MKWNSLTRSASHTLRSSAETVHVAGKHLIYWKRNQPAPLRKSCSAKVSKCRKGSLWNAVRSPTCCYENGLAKARESSSGLFCLPCLSDLALEASFSDLWGRGSRANSCTLFLTGLIQSNDPNSKAAAVQGFFLGQHLTESQPGAPHPLLKSLFPPAIVHHPPLHLLLLALCQSLHKLPADHSPTLPSPDTCSLPPPPAPSRHSPLHP